MSSVTPQERTRKRKSFFNQDVVLFVSKGGAILSTLNHGGAWSGRLCPRTVLSVPSIGIYMNRHISSNR